MNISTNLKHTIQIEVLDALFEKCGLSISNISITEEPEYDDFILLFEVMQRQGSLDRIIHINAVTYASNGSILNQNSDYLDDDFMGFRVMDIQFNQKISQVAKIRIYPS